MDGVNLIQAPGVTQASRQDIRAQSGRSRRADEVRPLAAGADTVEVARRSQAEAAGEPVGVRSAITSPAGARAAADEARDWILQMPAVATWAQANSSADAVLEMLR